MECSYVINLKTTIFFIHRLEMFSLGIAEII